MSEASDRILPADEWPKHWKLIPRKEKPDKLSSYRDQRHNRLLIGDDEYCGAREPEIV